MGFLRRACKQAQGKTIIDLVLHNRGIIAALKEARQLVRKYPDNTTFLFLLGDLLAKTGRVNRAREKFRKILVIDANHEEAKRALESTQGPPMAQ